jgi:DNA-binding LytR/AlgR family response regulator
MIKCIIIDDEPMALDILRDYVEKVPFLELAGSYRNPLTALEDIQKKGVDLLFLDINMPDLTGMQFLKTLVNQPMVIFTTAYSEYAVESYDYKAVDYLLKPIEFERFLKASTKALKQFMNTVHDAAGDASKKNIPDSTILVKSGTDYHQIRLSDIYYIEGAGNYVLFVTPLKKIPSLTTMKETIDLLPGDRFIRIHRSFIVAFQHIDVIEKDIIRIRKKKIPIGEAFRQNLQQFIEKQKKLSSGK